MEERILFNLLQVAVVVGFVPIAEGILSRLKEIIRLPPICLPGPSAYRSKPARVPLSAGWRPLPARPFIGYGCDAQGNVERYRVTSPSFTNWHGFHLAAETFAFQDFPMILATLALSNAECDR